MSHVTFLANAINDFGSCGTVGICGIDGTSELFRISLPRDCKSIVTQLLPTGMRRVRLCVPSGPVTPELEMTADKDKQMQKIISRLLASATPMTIIMHCHVSWHYGTEYCLRTEPKAVDMSSADPYASKNRDLDLQNAVIRPVSFEVVPSWT